jgi:ribonuclease-3
LADPAPNVDRYRTLHSALGYVFDDEALLDHALTHRSWCAENRDRPSNERLEFLGDAVLGMSITDSLYHNRPEQVEGDLAKARAEVVSTRSLAVLARSLDLGGLLYLGKGEELSGGRDKESILADAMEAVFAAVYIDGGWEHAKNVVLNQLQATAELAQITPGERDFKTRLQELAAERSLPVPRYEVSSTGPDHGRQFVSTVHIGETVGEGRGTSKKQAQQHAAEQALFLLDAGTTSQSDETAPVEQLLPQAAEEQ